MLFKSGLVTQVSGSIGGMTGSHNRGGLYFRARSIPVDPGSTLQQAMRSIVGALAARWRDTLTDAQRDDWRTYATNTPLLNPLGDSRDVGGLAMFIRGNSVRLQLGEVVKDNAPTSGVPELTAPTGISLANDDGLLEGTIIGDPWASVGDSFLAIYASRELSPGIGFYKGPYRLLGSVEGNNLTPPTSFSVDYAAAFTTPTVGSQVRLQFRVVDSESRLSAVVREATITVAS